MYAFSCDGIIPGSCFFHNVDRRRCSLVRTGSLSKIIVWLACVLSFRLAMLSLGSQVPFSAMASITTIGLYVHGVRYHSGHGNKEDDMTVAAWCAGGRFL